MKLNSNVALTLILLTLMFGASLVSAAWGFALGREALKGITQPDVRPNSNQAGQKKGAPRREEVVLLKEEDVLANVKAQMEGKARKTNNNNESRNKALESETTEDTLSTPAGEVGPKTTAAANLPLSSEDKGVTLEVSSVRQQGGSLVLGVSLRNSSPQAVKFLYSFLNVVDDRGRALSASAEGLPGELPPQSEAFSGTVSIPTALLENSEKLSLTLTDYPNQQLQLQLANIPVVK